MTPFIETKARDWWEAKLRGERLPAHELPPELEEDLAGETQTEQPQ